MKSQKMSISRYVDYEISNPAFVFGGDVPQEPTRGSRKRREKRHWWQFWRK